MMFASDKDVTLQSIALKIKRVPQCKYSKTKKNIIPEKAISVILNIHGNRFILMLSYILRDQFSNEKNRKPNISEIESITMKSYKMISNIIKNGQKSKDIKKLI